MTAEYVRRYYRVPAARGGRVRTHIGEGRITSFDGQYLRVRIDGQPRTHNAPFHATWCMEYLDGDGAVIYGAPCDVCARKRATA